jgi:cobalt/nickel transport system permease protein
MSAIDRFAWTNRWHDRHPLEKLMLAGGMLIVALILPPLTTAPLVIGALFGAGMLGAGLPFGALLRPVAAAASIDFSDGLRIAFTPNGLSIAVEATLRSLAAVTCLALLILTTPVADLVPLLGRVGVPRVVRELILLIYHMVFIILERAATGRQAQTTRQGYDGFGRSLRSAGLLASTLFQRTLDRGRRLEIGLAARGYTGDLPLPVEHRILSASGLSLGLFLPCATAAASLLLARLAA